jgi:hypothetical protein
MAVPIAPPALAEPKPAAPITAPPTPPPAEPGVDPALLLREYVAGGSTTYVQRTGRGAEQLPPEIDDITRDFGADVYERMLVDPQVSACVTVFKASILETGLSMTSAVRDKNADGYDLAKTICDEAIDMLEDLSTPLDDVLWDLLDCLPFGYKIAEQIYRVEQAATSDRRIYRLESLKVKPRDSVQFVVDAYDNLVGIFALIPGQFMYPGAQMFVPDPEASPFVISPKKFAIASFRPKNADIRGQSLIRPAYNPWWRKQQILPEYLKYLAQFAGPSIWGTPPETARPQPSASDPNVLITPEEVLYHALLAFRNGTAAAFPYGTSIKEMAMQGEGQAFLRGLAQCDQQITKAVLTQELATEQSAKSQTRAAAQVHQDVLDTLIRQGKRHMTGMIRRQILRNWVTWNWGEQFARLAPRAQLGETEVRDRTGMWAAAAQLANAKYLHETQLQPLDQMLDLPVREVPAYPEDPKVELQKEQLDFQQEQARAQQDARPEPSAPDRVGVRPHERNRPQRRQPGDQPPGEQQDNPQDQPPEG